MKTVEEMKERIKMHKKEIQQNDKNKKIKSNLIKMKLVYLWKK